jgi:hypothetical protein
MKTLSGIMGHQSKEEYLEHALFLTAPEFDVVKIVHLVERADSNPAIPEGLVGGGHDGLLHIIEEDLDHSFRGIALNHDLVPIIVPGNWGLVLGEFPACDSFLKVFAEDERETVFGLVGGHGSKSQVGEDE